MGRKLFGIVVVACILFLTGCMNMYVRWPTTSREIESVYQSTGEMAGITLIASFPQMMADSGPHPAFMWENCISIPFFGLPCFVDTVLEGVVDTICLPYDIPVSIHREKDKVVK